MRPFLGTALGALLAASAAPAALAQRAAPSDGAPPQSAPISGIVYDVSFDSTTARRRMIHVAMSFATRSRDPVVLSLPAWTPGAYEITYFSKWVIGFAATGDGKPLAWDKLDYDTWRVRPNGARAVSVSFDYLADTLDNAMAWAQPDFALFNGTNLFLYPEGRGFDFPATVRIHTEPQWLVATGMTPADSPRTYTAPNYHELVDMPFFIGRFAFDSARVGERWFRIARYPAGSIPTPLLEQDFTQLGKVMEAEGAVFGEIPFRTYTLMQIADSTYGGISGLEHENSHVDVTSPFAIGQPILTSVYSHEIFHAWNVKRLRPADLWPYQYAHEQPTPWLWVSEGITDYYADLAEVRSGVIDSVAFFETTAGKMAEVANARPVALEDASVSTWVHPQDGTSDLYYPKGSLAGLMLDILIRDASDGRHSLDDVMRQLYEQAYKQGKGFTGDEWWSAVSAAAGGKKFDDFYAKYVDGRDPYPWRTILPLAGMKLTVDTARVPTLGLSTGQDSVGLRVDGVVPRSTADEAGIQPGDYLLEIADVPVSDSFVARVRQKIGTHPGAPVSFKVRRGEDTLSLTGKLQVNERVSMTLTADRAASPKAVRVRTGILHGR
ncbi:MAG TPA: PDZ domain-containing protein [Gemmatimonadaceae bacterium]|nr:PDZ domain-containing protein [Gemmatimonadaceae bacterium]